MRLARAVVCICLMSVSGFVSAAAAEKAAAGPLKLLTVSPAGADVPPARQIVFTFDRPVVPLGRMMRDAAEIPISISPAVECSWRWIDRTSLACQLGPREALKRATAYTVMVQTGIKTQTGETLAEGVVHRFVTRRPKANGYVEFKEWRDLGTPVMRVSFDQVVRTSSVDAALHFDVDGDSVPVTLERAPVEREWSYEEDEGEGDEDAATSAPEETDSVPPDEARAFLVRPARPLPADATVKLEIGPGVRGVEGAEPGIDDRTLITFATFPAFRFIGLRCRDGGGEELMKTQGTARPVGERCNPLGGAMLVFSAPVAPEQVRDHVAFTPDLRGGRTDYDPWAGSDDRYILRRPHSKGQTYTVWIPELLRADDEYRIASPGGVLQDAFGRPLEDAIAVAFRTAPREPNLVFVNEIAALEKGVDSELPVYTTNLRLFRTRFRTLTTDGISADQDRAVPLPKVKDIAFATPLGVREMLGGRSGVVSGVIESDPKVKNGYQDEARRFLAQVSPWQVHVKFGHYNTLVWITDLVGNAPVSGATVSVANDRYASLGSGTMLRTVTSDALGLAVLPGSEQLDPGLDQRYLWDDAKDRLVVTVRKGQDMAVVPLDRHFELDAYQASSYQVSERTRELHGHLRAWGTTAQGVYRAGDVVQFKLWVRDQDNRTMVAPPSAGYQLEVIDPTDATVHQVDKLTLSEFGAYSGEFKVSAQAPVGWYQFRLKFPAGDLSFYPMRVLIADFQPAPFRVTTELGGDLFQQGDPLPITSHARLHAGGPYGQADARVTVTLDALPLDPRDPVAASFRFDTTDHSGSTTLHQSEASLDANGDLATNIEVPESKVSYGRITVESAVRDERGKYIASVATATYHGRDRYVGIRTTRWVFDAGKPAAVDWLVVDGATARVADAAVDLTVERRETKGVRAKGAGNAYLMKYTSEWVPFAECHGVSTLAPNTCAFTPDAPGTYRVTARVKDAKQREHSSATTLWVAGKGQVMWEEPSEGAVQLIPERTNYAPGDRARVLVQNPLPGATALISVERYGVIRAWTQVLKNSTEIIEVPIEPDYVPGFYLSVVLASPRVAAPLEDGQVDLGKPTLRMGYIELRADEKGKRLVVKARSDRESYRPRSKVNVTLETKLAPKTTLPIEYAVVVIDEAVFDLNSAGDAYYDPHRGLWSLDGLDLRNYNLLSTLVGRRKFEKKGANPGGDGSLDFTPRSDFKYVAYWNPSLRAAADGSVSFALEVPDNLTSWRVFAMAVTSGDRLGVGTTAFKVNRPTEVRPVTPNQVTGGDRFGADFSVMNRTDKERTLKVELTAGGALAADSPRRVESVLKLGPFQRGVVTIPVVTAGAGKVELTVKAGDAADRDGMTHAVPVIAARATETAATWGTTAQGDAVEAVAFPTAMQPGVGALSLVMSPSVIANLDGAFRYQRDYPYMCWEQRLSRGMAGLHFTRLQGYLAPDTRWPEAGAEFRSMLDDAASYQAPNGGMAFWVPRDDYVSPYLSAYTALAMGWARRLDQPVPARVKDRLLGYLDGLLKRNVVPSFYDAGMSATVRAVSLDALAERGKLQRADLERYRAHLPRMSLFGKAHMLHAATRVAGGEKVAREAFDQIMARSNRGAGKAAFEEVLDDGYRQLLATPLRDQCSTLSALVAYGATPAGGELVGNLPFMLMRTIVTARGGRDHWENTQENAFCMNALLDYSAAYERTPPAFEVEVKLDGAPLGKAKFASLRDAPQTIERKLVPEDAGRNSQLSLTKVGPGRVYYAARLSWAPTGAEARATNAGMELRREYSVQRDGKWELLASPFRLTRGELVRVDLYLDVPSTRHFVVVADPVPGGLEPVNRDLATASGVDAGQAKYQAAGGSIYLSRGDWNEVDLSSWSFYHREARFESVRFYADYLPAGAYHLSYTAQAIAEGSFGVGASIAEEMYDPDVFGRSDPAALEVGTR